MIVINKQESVNHPEIIKIIEESKEPFEVTPLELGDFMVTGIRENIVVERKAAQDFWGSVIDGRLWSQAKDLNNAKDEGYFPIVIIELEQLGNLTFNTRTRKRQYVDTLLFRQNEMGFYNAQMGVASWGIHIILTSSPSGTARFLIEQSRKLGQPKEKKEYPERGGFRRNLTLEQRKLYLLECFGAKTSKTLLKSYMTIGNLVQDAQEDIDFIRHISDMKYPSGMRIGVAKAKEIRAVLVE